jgi:hypothetical protein
MDSMKIGSINPVLETSQIPPPKSFEPSRPSLTPRLIGIHISLGRTADKISHNILDGEERKGAEAKVLSQQDIEHLQKIKNRTWLEDGWSAVKTVADCIVSVVSFALGGYFLTTGNATEGNLLIAAGIFNILQTVFARQGMWDWITETLAETNDAAREKLKMAFPIIISLLGLGFSIAGSRLQMQPNTLSETLQAVSAMIKMGGDFVSKILSIQKGFDDARLLAIQGPMKKNELDIDLLARLVDYCLKQTRQIKSTIKKAATVMMQSTTLASNKV